MTISIIAAVAKNRAIGFENKLIYWLPNDLKRFKALTTGHLPGCEVFPTLDAALQSCQPDEDIYIIGGARVYEQAISKADRLCLTEVDDIPAQADTFFPDYSDWQVVNKEAHPKDERHAFEYAFTDYERAR